MTRPTVLFRRSMITAAIAGGLACLSGPAWFFTGWRRRGRPRSAADALAAVCAELAPAPAIGEACLQALPGVNSKELLSGLLLKDILPTGETVASARTLTDRMRERSQDDFRNGRIVTVNGWILSTTETRFYALATLLRRA